VPQDKKSREQLDLEEQFRNRLSVPGEYADDIIGPDGIRVPRAPNFRKPTLVVGTDLARKVEQLQKIAPETRGRASLVSPHYTTAIIAALGRQASVNPAQYKDPGDKLQALADKLMAKDVLGSPRRMNVVGLTDPQKNELYVSQGYDDNADDFNTVAHEYQHLMGLGGRGVAGRDNSMASEDEAGKTGELGGKLYKWLAELSRRKQ
jgi:hypothetical protein